MKDQYSEWSISDLDTFRENDYFPNWIRVGYNTREEAINGIMLYMSQRQGMFDRLGLTGPIIKREKKKK